VAPAGYASCAGRPLVAGSAEDCGSSNWAPEQDAFYMLYLYAKNEQDDLTPAQVRQLGRLVREEFK
jgi:hypothetical protein